MLDELDELDEALEDELEALDEALEDELLVLLVTLSVVEAVSVLPASSVTVRLIVTVPGLPATRLALAWVALASEPAEAVH